VQATQYFGRTEDVYHTLEVFLTHGLAWFGLLYLVAGITVTLQAIHERESGV
jgi:hypothetical protein